ncbi:MAG: 16S rRNA (cytosine(1402)-N(4))-methyltransferase RsmH [Ignavibacteriae bacterium]|nr:16S rRNA (cytosine(1402)-N(4))-methyltransferase RsmH [Ignavibacteriota bacterium]MCB9217544.1 16S rRNA (cytosine(1402)-N(4))-methyltransferase RsmH [Ignavibacteria bacterium]
MESSYHIPVMLREVLEGLRIESDGLYVDGTFGGGGHSQAILEQLGVNGRVIGCDADAVAVARAKEIFSTESRLQIRHGYFSDICREFAQENLELSGVLLDLGVSSRQLDSDQIGLSYRESMPLDMRFNRESRTESAADIINDYSTEDLATLFRQFGEEPAAWTIAQAISARRVRGRVQTTGDLRQTIEGVIPGRFIIKTLSRVFQALRIAVNDELGELERGLDCFIKQLKVGGRIVVLTYHSLEDRIVKTKFREAERGCECPPGLPECQCGKQRRLRSTPRKPLRPTAEEVRANPRARSAKLRIGEKVAEEGSR